MNEKNKKFEMMLTMEYYPSVEEAFIKKDEYIKYPIAEISSLGVVFSGLLNSTRTMT